MIVLRFKVQCQPDKREQLMAAVSEIVAPARATKGVISFDIGRDLIDPQSFIATGVYEDHAALERQESLPQVDTVMAMLPGSAAAAPERTEFQASVVEPALA
jgi:quinol monooxygenase YgiN